MSYLDDMYKAMDIFTEGTRQLAVTNRINEATQQVNELQKNEMDLLKRNAQQMNIAKQLSLQMTQAGAPMSHVQQVYSMFAPEQLNTSADAERMAAQATDPAQANQYLKVAKSLGDLEANRAKRMAEAKEEPQTAGRIKEIEAQGMEQRRAIEKQHTLGMNAPKLRPMAPSTINKINDVDKAINGAENILAEFNSNPDAKDYVGPGNVMGIVPFFKSLNDANFASFKAKIGQDFDQYRIAVTGAGAGKQEIDKLEGNRPNIKDTPEAFALKYKGILESLHRNKATYIQNQEKGRVDIGGFADDIAVSLEKADQYKSAINTVRSANSAKEQQAAAAIDKVVRAGLTAPPKQPSFVLTPPVPGALRIPAKDKAGNSIFIWKAPNGKYYPAD